MESLIIVLICIYTFSNALFHNIRHTHTKTISIHVTFNTKFGKGFVSGAGSFSPEWNMFMSIIYNYVKII